MFFFHEYRLIPIWKSIINYRQVSIIYHLQALLKSRPNFEPRSDKYFHRHDQSTLDTNFKTKCCSRSISLREYNKFTSVPGVACFVPLLHLLHTVAVSDTIPLVIWRTSVAMIACASYSSNAITHELCARHCMCYIVKYQK